MRFNSGAILGLTLLAGILTGAVARAEESFPRVATFPRPCWPPKRASQGHGGRQKRPSRWIFWSWAAGRRPSVHRRPAPIPPGLQALLKEKLPAVVVNLSVDLEAKKTAAEVATGLAGLVEAKWPTLVIWQTGTVDAMRAVDPDDFRGAVDEGIAALQNQGVDAILVKFTI